MSGLIFLNTSLKNYPIFYKIEELVSESQSSNLENDYKEKLIRKHTRRTSSDGSEQCSNEEDFSESLDHWSGPVLDSINIPVQSVYLSISIFLGVDDEETIEMFKKDNILRMTYNPNTYLGPELGERSGFLLMVRRSFTGYLWKNGSEIVHRKISIFQDRKTNRLIAEATYNNAHARLCLQDRQQYYNGKMCTLCKKTFCKHGKEFGNGVFYVCIRGFEIDYKYKQDVRNSEWFNNILANESTIIDRIFRRISTVRGKYQNNVGAMNRTAVYGNNSAATVVLPRNSGYQARKSNSPSTKNNFQEFSTKKRSFGRLGALEEEDAEGGSNHDHHSIGSESIVSIDETKYPTEFKFTVKFDEEAFETMSDRIAYFQNIYYQFYGDGQLISGSEAKSQKIDSVLEWTVKINFDRMEIETYKNFELILCTNLQELNICKFKLDSEQVMSGKEFLVEKPFWSIDLLDFMDTSLDIQFKFDSVIEVKSFWKLTDELKSLFKNEELSPEVFCTLQAADLKLDSDIVKILDEEDFNDEEELESSEAASSKSENDQEYDASEKPIPKKSEYIEISHVISAQLSKFKNYRHFYLTFYANGNPVRLCQYKVNMKFMIEPKESMKKSTYPQSAAPASFFDASVLISCSFL